MDIPECDNPAHKGHRYYAGGQMDGHISHLVHGHASDFPKTLSTLLRDGVRSWYELDYEASSGNEVVYRFTGCGAEFPGTPA